MIYLVKDKNLSVAVFALSICTVGGELMKNDITEKLDKFFWTFVALLLCVGVSIPLLLKMFLNNVQNTFNMTTTTATTTATSSSTMRSQAIQTTLVTSTTTTSRSTQTGSVVSVPLIAPRPSNSDYVHIAPTGDCFHKANCPNLGHRASRYRPCKVCVPTPFGT